MKKHTGYIGFIETLRAVAALAVLLFHFIHYFNGNTFIIENETVRNISEHGAQGVELFYCISGCVIMLALSKNDYKIQHYGRYLLKRILRIIPVYWMTIVGIYAIDFVFGKLFWDSEMIIDWTLVFANAFFLVDIFDGQTWINPVFSTLGVEFQFYLLIGLFFPLFRRNERIKYGALLLWIIAGYFTMGNYTVLVNAPFFIAGILLYETFKFPEKNLPRVSLLLLTIYLGIVYPMEDMVIVVLAILCFTWWRPSVRPLNKIGTFSYSLYLTHGMIGGWFLFFFTRAEHTALVMWMLIVSAVLLSLIGAYVFYWFFEKPAMRWSKKITWKVKQ